MIFDSAVICTDGSSESDQLMAVASRLRQFGVSRVTLVCPFGPDSQRTESELGERLLAQESALGGRGFEVHAVLRRGAAASVVDAVAEETGAQLVVVGVRGLGRASKLLVEATTADAVALCRPMLSIRISAAGCAPVRLLSQVPMLSKVMLAVDYTEASQGAIESVEGMIAGGLTELVLFHVTAEKAASTEDRIKMRSLGDRLRAAGRVRITEEIVPGSVAEAITHRSHSGDVTLTVLGSNNHGLYSEMVAGSVGSEVARHIECPLLVVAPATCVSESARLTA